MRLVRRLEAKKTYLIQVLRTPIALESLKVIGGQSVEDRPLEWINNLHMRNWLRCVSGSINSPLWG